MLIDFDGLTIIIGIVIYILICIFIHKKYKKEKIYYVFSTIMFCYFMCIAKLTLFPIVMIGLPANIKESINIIPFHNGINRTDILNLIMTIPLGIGIPFITKINKQQKTIQKQLSDAKRQQKEFQIITRQMQEGLLVIDTQTDLLSSNASALELLDAGQVKDKESVLALNRSEAFEKTIDKVLRGEHVESVLNLGERYCQICANPVFDKETIAGAVILLIDVTEKMQRDSLRREFTANVSHELKTPLTSISGFAEIIQSGFVKQEDVRKFAGKIFDETQRLVTLVDDIIKISQLDENCQPYQREKVDIYNLAKDVLSRLQESANKAQVQLNMEGEHAELETVLPILDEIVSNLCDNAIKYNKKGGSVTVTVLNARNQICLSVRDTGIGITAAEKSRVFERVYRVDKSHSKEIGGTGLGLSIVKHGAAYLGAKVELESTIDKGSTFRLIWQK